MKREGTNTAAGQWLREVPAGALDIPKDHRPWWLIQRKKIQPWSYLRGWNSTLRTLPFNFSKSWASVPCRDLLLRLPAPESAAFLSDWVAQPTVEGEMTFHTTFYYWEPKFPSQEMPRKWSEKSQLCLQNKSTCVTVTKNIRYSQSNYYISYVAYTLMINCDILFIVWYVLVE